MAVRDTGFRQVTGFSRGSDPMPTNLDDLWGWVSRHYAPHLRRGVFNKLGPQVRAREVAAAAATPRQAPSPAATPGALPPPPSAPEPLPPSLSFDARLQGYTDRINSLPGIFNAQRGSLFAQGQRSLLDQGYFDTADVQEASRAADGSVTFRLQGGPEGQAFRGSRNNIAAGANSRGALDSSATRERVFYSNRDLTNARDSILRNLAGGQDDITQRQTTGLTELDQGRREAQGEYADWRANQSVAPVVPPAPPPAPATPGAPRALPGNARWKVKPRNIPTKRVGGWWVPA